jgi:hypothetical protein
MNHDMQSLYFAKKSKNYHMLKIFLTKKAISRYIMIEENMNISIQRDQNLVICPKKREETKTWSFVQKKKEKPRLGYHKTYIQVFENKAKT